LIVVVVVVVVAAAAAAAAAAAEVRWQDHIRSVDVANQTVH